jgi:outer membrane protein TolC
MAAVFSPLFGQDGPPAVRRISPDEAVSLAIQNNLSLESSRNSVAAKKRASDYSWNVFIPTIDVSGSLVLPNAGTTVSTLMPFGTPTDIAGVGTVYHQVMPYSMTRDPAWSIAASLQISLNLNYALIEGMKNARLEYEGGLITLEKAKAQLERDVRKSYYQMLLLQEQIALFEDNFAAAEQRAARAQTSYRSGLAPELTYLQAQVAVENMKPNRDQLVNGLKLAMASFAMNLGLPYDTPFELVPVSGDTVFIPLDVADLISRASANKLDIQELRHQALVLQSTRKKTVYQLFTPNVSLSWNAAPAFTGELGTDSLFSDSWRDSGMFRVTLAYRLNTLVPFTSEGQGLNTIDEGLRSLAVGLAQMVQGTELEVYNTVFSLEQAKASVESQQHTVAMAERTYRLTDQAYRAGLSDLQDVQNAEAQVQQARLGILEQQFNYIKGLIDLEYSIGVPFGTLSSPGAGTEARSE